MRVVHPSVYLKSKERRKKRGTTKYFVALIFLLVCGTYGYLASAVEPVYSVKTVYPHKIPAEELPFQWPASGTAAIGYTGSEYAVLGSSGGDTVLPTASTIKLLTALVVINQKPLGPGEDGERIYFNNDDVLRTNEIIALGGAYFPITNGTSMSYRQALEAMLISSSNNIAEKLAIWAFGGTKEYQSAAQIYLSANGLTDTDVDDSTGLSSKTTSTSEDMLKISLLALEVPVIREVVSLDKTRINGFDLISTNTKVKKDNIDGLKTGYTPEAGNCLLLSKTMVFGSREYTFVAAVFGQVDKNTAFIEAERLLGVLSDNMKESIVVARRSKIADISSPWGETIPAIADTDIRLYKWTKESVEATANIPDITVGLKGQTIGYSEARGQRTNIVLSDNLPSPSIWWRLTHAFDAISKFI